MNDPAVLLYTSDFLTGVMDMTMEERGQYITLLCYQHQKGHFKEETIRLLVGLANNAVMEHFILDEQGLFYNKRMDIEKEKRHKFVESRRENAKKGGRPNSNNNKPSGKPKINLVDKHKHNLMGNEDINDNIDSNINKKEYIDMAKYMFNKIKELNSNNKEPNYDTWANDFRKLVELDKREPQEIGKLINWIYADSFWKGNILSPSKLREKYDQLIIKAKSDKGFKSKEESIKELEEMMKYR
jgi:uncharacterized protein YdaU (DUF1376 family)